MHLQKGCSFQFIVRWLSFLDSVRACERARVCCVSSMLCIFGGGVERNEKVSPFCRRVRRFARAIFGLKSAASTFMWYAHELYAWYLGIRNGPFYVCPDLGYEDESEGWVNIRPQVRRCVRGGHSQYLAGG